jgi:HD superfamily phosphohydrolase
VLHLWLLHAHVAELQPAVAVAVGAYGGVHVAAAAAAELVWVAAVAVLQEVYLHQVTVIVRLVQPAAAAAAAELVWVAAVAALQELYLHQVTVIVRLVQPAAAAAAAAAARHCRNHYQA